MGDDGTEEKKTRKRFRAGHVALGDTMLAMVLGKAAFLKYSDCGDKSKCDSNRDHIKAAEVFLKKIHRLSENFSITDKTWDEAFEFIDKVMHEQWPEKWKWNENQRKDWITTMTRRARNIVWHMKDFAKHKPNWLKDSMPWVFEPPEELPTAKGCGGPRREDEQADGTTTSAFVRDARARVAATAPKIYTYGWKMEANLAFRLEAGLTHKDHEISLPLSLEGLADFDEADMVVAAWPDGHKAEIPEMKVRRLRQILSTSRGREAAVLFEAFIPRNKHKLTIDQRPDRGLLISVYEQQKQILQV